MAPLSAIIFEEQKAHKTKTQKKCGVSHVLKVASGFVELMTSFRGSLSKRASASVPHASAGSQAPAAGHLRRHPG